MNAWPLLGLVEWIFVLSRAAALIEDVVAAKSEASLPV